MKIAAAEAISRFSQAKLRGKIASHYLAGSLLALCATQGFAENSPPNAPASDTVGAGALSEIIVTAQRRSEQLEKTPLTVEVLSSAALSKLAVRSEQDLQTAVPGLIVRAAENVNNFSFTIRGQLQDTQSGTAPAVQTYVNEVHIDTTTSSAFYDLQSIQVLKGPQGTLFGLNSTGGAILFSTTTPRPEFGGYATVRAGNYGRFDQEGAINLPFSDTVFLRVAGVHEYAQGYVHNIADGSNLGQVDESGARVSLLVKPTEEFKNTLVVDYLHQGGTNVPGVTYSVYAPGETHNGYMLNSTVGAIYSPLADIIIAPGAWEAYLAAHPKAYPGGAVAFAALQNARGPYVADINNSYEHRADTLFVSNVTTYDFASDLQFKNIIGFGDSKTHDHVEDTGGPYSIIATTEPDQGQIFTNNDFTEEAQVNGKAIDRHLNFALGLFYSNSTQRANPISSELDFSPFIPATPIHYNAITRSYSYALYGQGTYDLHDMTGIDGLAFTVGGRFTHEKIALTTLPSSLFYNLPGGSNYLDTSINRPSWQVGLQEQLNQNLLLYVVSRASFRSPGFNYNAPPFPGYATNGGAEYAAESAQDVELGSKFEGKLGVVPVRANIALYREYVHNVQRSDIVELASTGTASALTVNVPKAVVDGVELDGQINPLNWLQLGGAVAYTDARFTDNKTVIFGQQSAFGPYSNSPRWSGSIFAEGDFPLSKQIGNLSVRVDAYAQSSFYFSSLNDTTNPDTELPSYGLLNARLALNDVAGIPLTLALYAKNLTDRTYYVGGLAFGTALGVNTAVPGAPRTYFAEATYKF